MVKMSKKSETNVNDEVAEPLVIDSTDSQVLQNLWNNAEFDKYFNSPTHWTRITIINGKFYDKDMVLRTVLSNVYPIEVIPALYWTDGNDSYFLLRNCSIFIKKLAWLDLKLKSSDGNCNFDIRIIANYLPFSLEALNPFTQIRKALAKRYNLDAKTLDLTNFSQDDCLKDLYFHLNIPQCTNFIFEQLPKAIDGAKLYTLVLQHNDLCNLESLTIRWSRVLELDLRNNNITWEGLERLIIRKGIKLISIWLDGNPLCVGISEAEYVRKIIAAFPSITQVDGVDVSNLFLWHPLIRNYLRDTAWSTFVDHFLHHYFGLLESSNLYELVRMYHQEATFSYTAIHNPEDDQITDWNRLSAYKTLSRNLLTISDVNKAYSTMKVGPTEIIETLRAFPAMQFDPGSFRVDVPISQIDVMVLINVNGVFQDHAGLFNFNRSFILTPYKKNTTEWKIQNDMMTIVPANNSQTKSSNIYSPKRITNEMKLKLNPAIKEKDVLLPTVCKLTKLREEWAERFLKESSWDLEMTLQAFTDQLKSDQIPMRAFSI